MKSRLIFPALAFCVLAFATVSEPRAEPLEHFNSILAEIDKQSDFGTSDFAATNSVVVYRPDKAPETIKAQVFRRDYKSQFVIVVLDPSYKRGQGYLQADENVWFYDPESGQFSHTNLKDNFQDSDTKNGDFNKSTYAEDYEVTAATEETLGKYDCWVLDLKSKNDSVAYPFMKIWVTKDSHLMLKAEDYSLTKRLMRTVLYPSYTRVADHVLPTRVLFIDNLTQGNRTEVTRSDLSLSGLPDSLFTKSYLQRVNR